MKKYFLYAVMLSVIIIPISCGKGGGGGGDNPAASGEPTVDPSTVISFTTSGAPSVNSAYLEEVSKDANKITLALKVKGGSNVFGAAVEITYDSSLISYTSAAEGTYLNQDGTSTIFASSLNNSLEGILLLGCDRRGNIQGVNGDGVLATIIFKAKSNQSNTAIGINATNSALKLPTGSSSKNIDGTSWLGGTLSYQ